MARKYLLPENGNFYKANLHGHTNWSDGTYSPEEMKRLYKQKGYSVVSITDHDALYCHRALDDENFLTIAGYEIELDDHTKPNCADNSVIHMCLFKKDPSDIYQLDVKSDIRAAHLRWAHSQYMRDMRRIKGKYFPSVYSPENINAIVDEAHRLGFLVQYNHPKWSRESYPQYINYENFDMMEIYNHSCYAAGYPEINGDVYDDMLKSGKRLYCTANDDCHMHEAHPKFDMFGGFTVFKAPYLSYAAIIDAMEKGNFYASRGPEITDLYVEDEKVTIKTSKPMRSFQLHTGHRSSNSLNANGGEGHTEATFKIPKNCHYIRLEVIDFEGFSAYTNAYFIDEIL